MLKLLLFNTSQALLDVYTIEREIGKLDGIKVGLVGDLANGRTVRSLAYLLAKYCDVKFYFVSPNVVKMKVIVANTCDLMNITEHDALWIFSFIG
jgi:aspartate carbamoyltransferase catalytic subunit